MRSVSQAGSFTITRNWSHAPMRVSRLFANEDAKSKMVRRAG